ncbi:MAG: VWA domain-containing protein [Bryobacteraceae bacterium]|nr:VWA domain-containing protein [Bryobacteraceae bacterium]
MSMRAVQPLLIAACCVALAAQQPSSSPVPKAPGGAPPPDDVTIRTTVNVVVAPVTVVDKDGRHVNGLEPHDFKLYDNEILQKINEDVAFQPLSLVVAVQANWRVDAVLPKLQKIGPLFSGLVLGETGEIAVVSFDHQIRVRQDFTSDADLITKAFVDIKAGSNTHAMVDAVTRAARMLRRRPDNRRKVILLISETRDGGSEGKLRDAITDLQLANVSLYSVNMNRLVTNLTQRPDLPRPSAIPPTAMRMPPGALVTPDTVASLHGAPGQAANLAPLLKEIMLGVKAIFVDNPVEVFTKFTGGREYSFVKQNDLERAIADIGEELRAQYLLSYSPNNKMQGGYHEIRVEVNRPGLEIRTRPGYWMAAVPE